MVGLRYEQHRRVFFMSHFTFGFQPHKHSCFLSSRDLIGCNFHPLCRQVSPCVRVVRGDDASALRSHLCHTAMAAANRGGL